MKWMVLILFFVAIFADIYIYRAVVCTYVRRLSVRIAYIFLSFVVYGAVISALLLRHTGSEQGSGGMIATMWLFWLFFLFTLPKVLFAAGALLDFPVKLIARRKVTVFRWIAVTLSIVVMVTMICGATVGRTKLRINEIEVCSDRIPESFDGYRVVQISDIHAGTISCPEKLLARIAGKIAALSPDMVVHTGDLVNVSHVDLTPEMSRILSGISAPDGVWSVWGNHDLGFYMDEGTELTPADNLTFLGDKVREMGWTTLVDRSVAVRRGGDSILLSGVNFPVDGRHNGRNSTLAGSDLGTTFAGMNGYPFSIVLAHTPQMWHNITDKGFGDLTLSGHTHAMQMKLRLFGREWSPAQYLYEEWSGSYPNPGENNGMLYVNDGIGCVGFPMRIGARPEVTLFILKRCE